MMMMKDRRFEDDTGKGAYHVVLDLNWGLMSLSLS